MKESLIKSRRFFYKKSKKSKKGRDQHDLITHTFIQIVKLFDSLSMLTSLLIMKLFLQLLLILCNQLCFSLLYLSKSPSNPYQLQSATNIFTMSFSSSFAGFIRLLRKFIQIFRVKSFS